MRKILYVLTIVVFVGVIVQAQDGPRLEERDAVRLAEAFHIAERFTDSLWPGWSEAPMPVLLVTDSIEFLINHPDPAEPFVMSYHDDLLAADVYTRPRQYPTTFLATFPFLDGTPTIVIGTAENTYVKQSTPWVATVLHEHFHQWQMSRPGYFENAENLGLAGDDTTGMWMLNYPFPYDSSLIGYQMHNASEALKSAIEARGSDSFDSLAAVYVAERDNLYTLLGPQDFKYFAFQAWQEGVARYTEYVLARWLAENYEPSPAFKALADYEPFGSLAERTLGKTLFQMEQLALQRVGRLAFYTIGFGEGLLLDEYNPGWKANYYTYPFDLTQLFVRGE